MPAQIKLDPNWDQTLKLGFSNDTGFFYEAKVGADVFSCMRVHQTTHPPHATPPIQNKTKQLHTSRSDPSRLAKVRTSRLPPFHTSILPPSTYAQTHESTRTKTGGAPHHDA